MAGGGISAAQLTRVGDLGAAILSGIPEAARAQVEPFIQNLVGAIYEAFSLATASTFTVGIVTSLVAAGLVLLLREAPAHAVATSAAPASAGAMASGPPQAGSQVHGTVIRTDVPVAVEIRG